MEAVDYLRAISRSWWVILIAVVAGGLGSYAVYSSATPQYEASVRLAVGLKATELDPLSAQSLAAAQAKTLAQVASTPPALDDALERAGSTGGRPSVDATASDLFVDITVTSQDPESTAAVANEFVETLPASTARLTGGATSYNLRLLAQAATPDEPVSPDLTRDLGFGLLGGLVLGLALALMRDLLNRSARSSDELRKATGLMVLGTVPRERKAAPLPTRTAPRSARAEAYRQIRTTLAQAKNDDGAVTVSVTSAVLGEGKTSVTTNVASAFARAGNRVAIIDADLRRPSVGAVFGCKNHAGLSEVLQGGVSLDDALVHLDEGRLAILPSGAIPPDPSELLTGPAFDHVLNELQQRYEFVFIDTPPVLPVTDSLIIAPKVDGVVLVVRLGRTSRVRVEHAMAALDRINANVFGVVPNHAGKGTDSDYSYPYRRDVDKQPTATQDPTEARPPSSLVESAAPPPGGPPLQAPPPSGRHSPSRRRASKPDR